MKKAKKVLALFLAAVMLVCTTVAVTVAYLTSQTDVVKNTMTVGKVEIKLDEAPVDAEGQEKAGDRVTENKYKLYPGKDYDKDPTVWVNEKSEDCYVFVKVVNDIAAIESDAEGYVTIAGQITDNGWKQLTVNGVDVANVYYYERVAKANDKLVVFENFTIDADVNNTTLAAYEGKTVKVEAYAVQEEGFDTAEAAWVAATATWNI